MPGISKITFAIGILFAALSLGAADKPSKNSKPLPAASPDKSVEALAATALKSVVTISHYGRDGKPNGVGAGFVVSSNGLLATCLHVIGEARPISVQLSNGKRYEVIEVFASDRKLDLALIRIAASNLVSLPLGDSDALKQGTPVIAIGNPLGLEQSVVQGVVSAKREFDGVEMIQLAIPIEPGNSGGPLLDMQGRVHGLLTMKSALTANLGFAMPVSALRPLLAKPNPVPMERWLTIGSLNSKEWTPVFGARWSRRGGGIQVDGLGTGFGGRALCLSQKIVPATPYEIAVSVKLDDEAGAAGLVFASDGGDKHYGFYPTGGQLRLTRFDGPDVFSWDILKTVPSPHYRPGEWNALKVRVEKEKIRCYVNDQLVIESDDHGLTGGRAGLAKFRDTKADFKQFQIGTNLAAASMSAELRAALDRQIQEYSTKPDPKMAASLQANAEASRARLGERARQLELEAARLRKLSLTVHRQSVVTNLVRALSGPEARIDLFHAALLVSKLDNPDLDVEAYRAQLEEMAREIAAKIPAGAGDAAKLAALTKYLFAENGFHGSRNDYYNRANSYLNEVLDDREGLPITLSVLFMELARRIGLDNIAGVPLPGHFVVKHVPKKGAEQLIDVFDGGKAMTRADAEELVETSTGGALTDEMLQAATKRDIILRMVNNLLGIAQRVESAGELLRYFDVIVALSPDAAKERWMRAMLRLESGDQTGAKEDLKWLLDHNPPGINLERAAELYRSL